VNVLSSQRRRALTEQADLYASNLDQAMPYLLSRGISQEAAVLFRLGYVTAGNEFTGRLAIPYVTPAGVVQIKYRCINQAHDDHKSTDCPKYLYEKGSGQHLYNAGVLTQAVDLVVVTEGELDTVCVQAYTGIPAVAFPGTKSWQQHKDYYRLCFESVTEVVVVADGEEVGREAARRVAESIGSFARVVEMPDGEDANSFIAGQGAGAFMERLDL
jgi:DNA primase